MNVSKKIKKNDKKIKENKARYDLDKQWAKIAALPSGNVGKHQFFRLLLWIYNFVMYKNIQNLSMVEK